MGLMETIASAGKGQAVTQIAKKLGVDGGDAAKVVASLVPKLSGGIKNNIDSALGQKSLLSALRKDLHDKYIDDPERLAGDDADADGQKILGHVVGDDSQRRKTAEEVAAETGVDAEVVEKMMPSVAAMTMGGVRKEAAKAEDDGDDDDGVIAKLQGALGDVDAGQAIDLLKKLV